MTELLVRPAAAADLEEAAIWYEGQRPGLGGEFLDAAEAAVKQILTFPKGYAILYKDRRRVLLERFPYSVRLVGGLGLRRSHGCTPTPNRS